MRPHPPQRALAMGGENVLDRHRALGGLVDQPVMSLHRCSRTVRGPGHGALRGLAQQMGAQHQSRAQPRVPQPRPADLVVRPGCRVEPVADLERGHVRRGRLEGVAPRRLQHIQIHALARFRCRVRPVLAPAPAGRTHSPPEGSPPSRSRRRTSRSQGDSRRGARSRHRPPGRPGPTRPERHAAGAPATGTGPAPGAGGRVCARRPIQASPRTLAANAQPTIADLPDSAVQGPTNGPRARVLMRHQRVPIRTRTSAKSRTSRPWPARQPQEPPAAETTRPPRTAAGRPVAAEKRGPPPRGRRRRAARALRPRPSRKSNASQDLPEPVNALRHRPDPRASRPAGSSNLSLNLHARHRARWLHEVQRKVTGQG